MKYNFTSRKLFLIFNYVFLTFVGILCLLPFINMLAISFSSGTSVAANEVKFWPIGFNIKSYLFVMNSPVYVKALLITVERVVLGVAINMILTIIVAYPLSKEKKDFHWRGFYVWFFVLTILFSGGLIPWYMVVKYTGLIDSIWALIIPSALPVFNMIVLLNFFRGLPKELEEAAFIDGAGHMTTLWKIYLPISKPALATLTLFCIVGHWNSWFDGLILMNSSSKYPLQSYLQTTIIKPEVFFKQMIGTIKDGDSLALLINDRTTRAAQLFVASVPVLIAYPLLQKYFTTGLVLGSVKG